MSSMMANHLPGGGGGLSPAIILWCWANVVISIAVAMPPQNPLQCNATGCTLYNSYGVWGDRKECRSPRAVFPTTEEELRAAVADAHRRNEKIKVVTRFSHSIPKLACPTNGVDTIFISTERYNSSIDVDVANRAVTADAGVGLRALIDRVEGEGLSLVASPYWEGVTVAGVVSTGAHGSSWWGKGGAVHEHVIGISLVVPATASEGYAKVVRLTAEDPLFNAAKVSLGLLGVISKVTLLLEPAFKRSITFNFTNDNGLENEYIEHAKKHEFGDLQWYPSKNIAVYRYDDRVPLNTPGDGVNDFIGFQPNLVLLTKTIRAAEKGFEKRRDANGKCMSASTFMAAKKLMANGLKNNGVLFTGYPVVGRQGKMQTSGSCLYTSPSDSLTSCAWDPRINGLFFYETTAIIPAANFGDFIRDVKKLRDAAKPQSFCGADTYNGFLIRFVKASAAHLGPPEDSVVVDINYYRADDAVTPRLSQDVWEEVEQLAFFKHGARPHWGKNRDVAFAGVRGKYPGFDKFVAAKKELDPDNVFSGEWLDEVVFGKGRGGVKGDGCALEGLCVCSEDRHCSPSNGYFCRPGVVYKDARVCTYLGKNSVS
ncbi:PREDICTED: L-gulonolactone oxidase 3 [Ipomoea nil]|uniref:L-gulonolactone oxidase 3 n=1 Tax=Ipomoea nil TaxID=35883 RepID=UPI0009012475|nr:PREDICTED: L-gulonolactone oxidase 3 [Ipomoea nil]